MEYSVKIKDTSNNLRTKLFNRNTRCFVIYKFSLTLGQKYEALSKNQTQ